MHVDLGVAIFVDLLRLLSPTHIVRFIRVHTKVDPTRDLGPITEDLLKFTPGLMTTSAIIVPELQAGTAQGLNAVGKRALIVSGLDATFL